MGKVLVQKFKSHWGLIIFGISTVAALVKLSNPRHWDHYNIFTSSARALWAGETPYERMFGPSGYYFYSPNCGLTFYGLFAWMPDVVGIYAYMSMSIAAFILGVHYFLRSLDVRVDLREPWLNLFWFWISFELQSGIVATKPEVMITGLLFFVVGAVIRGKGIWWASLVFAMVLNWKFQPLPVFGLIVIALIIFRKRLAFIPLTLLFLVGWYYLPLVVLPFETFKAINLQQQSSLKVMVDTNWPVFVHVFKFMQNALFIPVNYTFVMIFSLLSGGVMAAVVAYFCWTRKGDAQENISQTFNLSVLMAFALGAAYMIGYSPLGQTNAYILVAPTLLAGVWLLRRSREMNEVTWHLRLSRGILFFGIVTAILNSDIVTKHGRLLAVHLGIKPLGALVLAVVIVIYLFKTASYSKQRTQGHRA